ncbi:MAG: glycosyltransferase [Lachnospiraceae bacterium]|nr:glycosyltransferase [Lachnospiraceae bacterium]
MAEVSVIIPVHNAGRFIEDTVRSVMAETYSDWEILLVEDHSTDNSLKCIGYIMEEFQTKGLEGRIRLLMTGEKRGAAAARNVGIEAAEGRYITFLDADDLWEPPKLKMQLDFMHKMNAAFSFTGYEFADETGVGIDKIVRVPQKMSYKDALKNTTIFTSTVMFDTAKIDKDIIMMPDVPSEDTATWWKVLKEGYTAYGLNRPLTLYRRSSGTLSSNKNEAIKRIWNLYRNVEGMGILRSAWCFSFYALHAVWRRL